MFYPYIVTPGDVKKFFAFPGIFERKSQFPVL